MEWLIGTLLVVGPCAVVIWFVAEWNLRLARKSYSDARDRIDRTAAASIASITENPPGESPRLAVTFHLKPGVEREQLVSDSIRLSDELNRYERQLGGRGLIFVRTVPIAGEPNRVRIEWAPVSQVGARKRLEQIVAVLAGAKAADMDTDPVAVVPSIFDSQQRAAFDEWNAALINGVV
jgi:hypothetical protein